MSAFVASHLTAPSAHTRATRTCKRRRRSGYAYACAQDGAAAYPRAPTAVKTVVYGEALMDLHECSGDSGDAEWMAYAGGAPLNLACGLGKLGHPTAYIGALGADAHGDALMHELRFAGVNVSGVCRLDGHPTRGVHVRFDDGQPTFAGYSVEGSRCADAQQIDQTRIPGTLFYGAQALCVGTLALASPGSGRTQRDLIQLADATHTRVAVDVNWRPVFWADSPQGINGARDDINGFLRAHASYVKASVEDLQYILGENVTRARDVEFVLHHLGDRCRGVIVTDGEHGAMYAFREPDNQLCVGTIDALKPPNGAIDCVGAGDAFLAGWLAEALRFGFDALADPTKLRRTLNFAVATARFVVAGKGAVDPQPDREAVEKLLSSDLV